MLVIIFYANMVWKRDVDLTLFPKKKLHLNIPIRQDRDLSPFILYILLRESSVDTRGRLVLGKLPHLNVVNMSRGIINWDVL